MMKPLSLLSAAAILALATGGAPAAPPAPDLSEGAINAASFADWQQRQATGEEAEAAAPQDGEAGAPEAKTSPDPFLIRLQILLDRAHASPGVIDGREGGNTDKAVRAFEEMRDLAADGELNEELWEAISADAAPVVKPYRLTREDVEGRYVPDLPSDYGALAKLDWLGYRGPAEMLAERFHMDEDLLRELNPGADFDKEGTTILVADPGPEPTAKVARIVVDKSKGELIAYGEDDRIVLVDPATIGSDDTPSPSGTMKVKGSAHEPTYEYDPEKNFRQGKNDEELTLPPGPNGPVGTVWIDLSKPTYGIHGTPEPSQIDKTASHGCVRLTNWDAEALSRLVKPAETVVEFKS